MTAELIDAIAESPNDDGPRLVYADWLQQQPDDVLRARGEYIALSCTTVRPKPSARIDELLAKHELAWVGPLDPLTANRVWSRGFLDGCELATRFPRGPVEPALGHPLWRLLRVLEAAQTTHLADDVARLVCQGAMSNLKGLSADLGVFRVMAESATAPRIAELAMREEMGGSLPDLLSLLPADCFAQLRRLHAPKMSPQLLSRVMRPELALIVLTRSMSLGNWLHELVSIRATLAEVRLVAGRYPMFERRGMELVLHHAGGAWNHLEVRWSTEDRRSWRDELIHTLDRLPANTIQRLSFVGPPSAAFDVARFKQRVTNALPGAIVE